MRQMFNKVIKPKKLAEGCTIGIVTPSAPIIEEQFDEGVRFLEKSGFEVIIGPNVRRRNGHVAGSDHERATDLHEMFINKNIDAIICSAGGSNSNRLLDMINYDLIGDNPKIFMGLSDPTVLLCAIYARTGLVTFHGPVIQFDMFKHYTPFTEKYMYKALFTTDPVGSIMELNNSNILRSGKTQGELIGGNLSCLELLLGTPYEPDWNGKILFWEDVFEERHSIDTKLTHFKNAGVFKQISGMVVGTLVECNEEEYTDCPSIEDIVLHACHDFDFPIVVDVNLGHTDDKITIPIGVKGEIDTSGVLFSIIENGVID